MASKPKMKPCPKCGKADNLAVYVYEQHGGARHVECLKCNYLGPAASSIIAAIKLHNESVAQAAA